MTTATEPTIIEIRDLDEAKTLLLQGLWLQRVEKPAPNNVVLALEWAQEIANSGQPLPPIGFVSDLGHALYRTDAGPTVRRDVIDVPGVPHGTIRSYEDHVLGKLIGDYTFERASDVLRQYDKKERAKGLSYVLQQFRERARFGGVHLNPAVIKNLLKDKPEQLLQNAENSLYQDGVMSELLESYETLITGARTTAEILGPEDLLELELGIALAEFGQRVALRQIASGAKKLEDSLPSYRIRPMAGRQEVPTRVIDEDTYPVGGFSSISNRGTIESLLHSQLAYMEPEGAERPDLFDIKFLRDELLYYARDENQFLRRRRTFVLLFYPDLGDARFKDSTLPFQRLVLLLSFVVSVVRKLLDWLSEDALVFELRFLPGKDKSEPLQVERELLEMIFREQILNGSVIVERTPTPQAVAKHLALKARRSLCHCLTLGMKHHTLTADDTIVTQLSIGKAEPDMIVGEDERFQFEECDEAWQAWTKALETILSLWL